jgi:hypothetical protein
VRPLTACLQVKSRREESDQAEYQLGTFSATVLACIASAPQDDGSYRRTAQGATS